MTYPGYERAPRGLLNNIHSFGLKAVELLNKTSKDVISFEVVKYLLTKSYGYSSSVAFENSISRSMCER